MRTIIMTVGTSLLNNRDSRPWAGTKILVIALKPLLDAKG